MEAIVANVRPEALEEMRGIADGAGMSYTQIRDLNFSGELWSETFLDPPMRACTLVGLARTPQGELIGKSLDVTEGDEAYILAQRVQPANGYRFVHLTFAGTIWTDGGVNECGLAEVNSSLCTCAANWQGYPPFLMLRELLERCATVEEATRLALERDAINYGNNILLADESGDLAVVERSVTRQALRWRADDAPMLFATNHSLTPELEEVLGGGEILLTNSRERFERLLELDPTPPGSLEGLQNLFRDHTRPGGFCQHGQGNLHTIAALIVAPRLRQIWVAHGAPCQNQFLPISLERTV
jgi:isopenicillin-N N-acyltransferase-like protein